jgi:hypothetical protein
MGNSRETKKSPLHDAGTSEPSQINGHGCGQGHRHKSTPLEVDGEHDSYDNDSDSNDPITGTGTEVSSRSPCCALCCNCLATDENGNPSNESLLVSDTFNLATPTDLTELLAFGYETHEHYIFFLSRIVSSFQSANIILVNSVPIFFNIHNCSIIWCLLCGK